MKLTNLLKTFTSIFPTITRNDYRWFFIPTVQYSKFEVELLDDATKESKGHFRDRAVKAHFLCYTLNFYSKRTQIAS